MGESVEMGPDLFETCLSFQGENDWAIEEQRLLRKSYADNGIA